MQPDITEQKGRLKCLYGKFFCLSGKGGQVLLCPYCIWGIIMCAYARRRTHAHAVVLEHITLFIWLAEPRPLSPHPTAPQTLHCEPEQQPVCMWDLNTKVNLPEDYQLISTWDKTFGCIYVHAASNMHRLLTWCQQNEVYVETIQCVWWLGESDVKYPK